MDNYRRIMSFTNHFLITFLLFKNIINFIGTIKKKGNDHPR